MKDRDYIVRCPHCNSARVFNLRIDCDWGGLIGDYNPVNNDDEYTEEDLKMDNYDRPDVNVYHCLQCDYMWED